MERRMSIRNKRLAILAAPLALGTPSMTPASIQALVYT